MTAGALIPILMLAVVVEALVEYAKAILRLFTRREYPAAITQLTAVLCSVLLCLSAGADLFDGLGLRFAAPWVGRLLTGVFVSRGANFVNDIAGRLHQVTKTE